MTNFKKSLTFLLVLSGFVFGLNAEPFFIYDAEGKYYEKDIPTSYKSEVARGEIYNKISVVCSNLDDSLLKYKRVLGKLPLTGSSELYDIFLVDLGEGLYSTVATRDAEGYTIGIVHVFTEASDVSKAKLFCGMKQSNQMIKDFILASARKLAYKKWFQGIEDDFLAEVYLVD